MSRLVASSLQEYMADRAEQIEAALQAMLPPEETFPDVVHRAMRHSVFAGGKRLRPLLVLAAAETVGGAITHVLPAGCAIELIHTYSLIHDDLPSMDNSAVRRGRPTCHVVFGEAVAVLAGDALHALAFELLARTAPPVPPGAVVAVIREIATAIGTEGMVGGQVLDLLGERRADLPRSPGWPRDAEDAVHAIHLRKTAALIRASVRAGALLSGAPPAALDTLTRYGDRLGLAFQIIDDILDEVGETAKMGKEPQRDALAAKLTFPAVYGIEGSRTIAAAVTEEAMRALEPLAPDGRLLADLARFLLEREA